VPLAFLFACIIRTCARACCWNSTRLTADEIASSILLGPGMLSSLLRPSYLSAIHEPDFGAEPGICLWTRCGTISHHLAGVGADFGLGVFCGFGCSLSCSLCCGCCYGCCRSSGPSSLVVSACCEACSPPKSVLAVISLTISLSCRP